MLAFYLLLLHDHNNYYETLLAGYEFHNIRESVDSLCRDGADVRIT